VLRCGNRRRSSSWCSGAGTAAGRQWYQPRATSDKETVRFGQIPAEALVRPHLDEARRHHRHLQHIAEMRKHPRSDRPRRRSRIGEHAANRGDRCPVIGPWCRSIISRNQFQHRRCQRPARLEHPLPGILNSCGGEGLWRFTLPHSSSENSIPIMIRALRGQLSHRRAQAQFQRILREPDPLLRAALPAVAMPAVNPESTGKNQTHTGKQHPHNVRQLEHHQSDDRKATARKHSRYYRRDSDHPATSTPAGATGTVVARNHHPTLATEYHVLEFNPEGADFPANSTRTIDTSIFGAGASNPSSFGAVRSRSGPHREHHCRAAPNSHVTEKDSGNHQCQEAQRAFLGCLSDCFDHADRRPAACHWRHSGFTPITVTTATRTTWSPMSSAE